MSLYRKTVQMFTHHYAVVPLHVLVGSGCVAGVVFPFWFYARQQCPTDRLHEPADAPYKHIKGIPTGRELYFAIRTEEDDSSRH